jgi:D-alanine-D-alanine ligase
LKPKKVFAKEFSIDCAFPAFHGANGEDGTMQGLFEMANIPYVGCGVSASAIAMNKILTRKLLRQAGIMTPRFVECLFEDWKHDQKALLQKIEALQYPVFVKPACLGSSIGIAKAKRRKELLQGIEVAFHYGEQVIVEESVKNMSDITCAVLGTVENCRVSFVQETLYSGDFFDYDAKYLENGGAQTGEAKENIVIPARISERRTQEIQKLSKEVFELLGCSGIARVDFLYDRKQDTLYVNEINTLPGTLYHHLWKASGFEMKDVLETLLQTAQEKHRERNNRTTAFSSSILGFAHSVKLRMTDQYLFTFLQTIPLSW